jgi:hypothetical protein
MTGSWNARALAGVMRRDISPTSPKYTDVDDHVFHDGRCQESDRRHCRFNSTRSYSPNPYPD